MIVKCEQCQTRFKIPDEKVTEKGVKVRCTKCQHTFRVKREAGAEVTSPSAEPLDPFAKFGPTGPEVPHGEETRPALYAMGIEATKPAAPLAPSFAAQSELPREAFEGPTRIKSMPQPPPGRKPLTDPAPFDFAALSPPPPRPPSVPKSSPFDFGSMAPPPAPAQKSPGFEPQPFDFSSLAAPPATTEVSVKAPPPPAPKSASLFEPQPFDFSGLSAGPTAPPTAEPPRPKPAPKPSAFEPQPFDFSSLGDAPVDTTQREIAKHAPAPPPSHATLESQPFDFTSLGHEAPPPPPPPAARPAPSAPKPQRSAPPPPAPPPPPPPAPKIDLGPAIDFSGVPTASMSDVTEIDDGGGGLLVDVPPDTGSGSLSIDVDDGLAATPESRGALFDMSAVPEQVVNQLAPPDEAVVAKIALKKVTAEELARPAAVEPEAEGKVTSSRRPKRSVVAMVWNVLSAAVLLVLLGGVATVVLNEGKVDAGLSWAKVKALFSTPRALVAFDISNGLYETRAGRPVFYVRGEVKNRGTSAGRVKVKAEILDGEDLVRAAEGFAGATPSPEDLYAITTADDLVKLASRLAPSAVEVKPGGEASFLVAFYEYPPDLKDFRVRVTLEPERGPQAQR